MTGKKIFHGQVGINGQQWKCHTGNYLVKCVVATTMMTMTVTIKNSLCHQQKIGISLVSRKFLERHYYSDDRTGQNRIILDEIKILSVFLYTTKKERKNYFHFHEMETYLYNIPVNIHSSKLVLFSCIFIFARKYIILKV